jgi:hypothetical protein
MHTIFVRIMHLSDIFVNINIDIKDDISKMTIILQRPIQGNIFPGCLEKKVILV